MFSENVMLNMELDVLFVQFFSVLMDLNGDFVLIDVEIFVLVLLFEDEVLVFSLMKDVLV